MTRLLCGQEFRPGMPIYVAEEAADYRLALRDCRAACKPAGAEVA